MSFMQVCDRIGELPVVVEEEVKVTQTNVIVASLMNPFDPIKRGLKMIEANTEKIRQLRDKYLTVVTEAAKNETQAAVAQVMSETATLGQKLFTSLKAIQEQNAQSRENEGDSVTQRTRENVYQCLSRQMSRSWSGYLQSCQECQQCFDARHRRQLHCVNNKLSEDQVDQILEGGQVDAILKRALVSDELRLVVRDIDERHREILKLERQVLELHELFKDLATLTDLQQESLDSIEGHVQRAGVHVHKAEENLQQAEKHQRGARKKKCYLLAGGMVALAAVAAPIAAKAS